MDLAFLGVGGAAAPSGALPVGLLVQRMAAAVFLGAVLSLRPWRLLMRRPLPRKEMVQAQLLLCAAAAVITVVIGDSVAKAFGLVGLGSFVRFRSGLKDPRDAALLFVLIGLGMACGHGSLAIALAGSALIALLLAGMDVWGGEEKPDPVAGPVRAEELA